MSYLDVPEGLEDDHVSDLLVVEGLHKVGIQGVEVGLYGGALHHKVLGHPLAMLVLDLALQLVTLSQRNESW